MVLERLEFSLAGEDPTEIFFKTEAEACVSGAILEKNRL